MLLTITSLLLIAVGLYGRIRLAYEAYSQGRNPEEDSRE